MSQPIEVHTLSGAFALDADQDVGAPDPEA